MDDIDFAVDILPIACFLLIMLLNERGADMNTTTDYEAAGTVCELNGESWLSGSSSGNIDNVTQSALNHFHIWSIAFLVDEDLGFWVKPRSTTWFSRFLLYEYDDGCWMEMFRFTKRGVFCLASLLTPAIRKKDTRYRLAVPVAVRLACVLFKLSHGASFLICSEMFAVGRSTVSVMLRQVVQAINVSLRKEIQWPWGEHVTDIANGFQELCGLPGIVGAIDGTHFDISKPHGAASDYYYFKSGGYSLNCQAVVDSSKRFLDIYVGMPGSTNDARVLRRSTLFHRGQHRNLWDNSVSFSGFTPYLLGDSGFPLLPWLMVPHRRVGNFSLADRMFNRKLSRGRGVVENAFALLKLSFRELHGKCELDVSIVPNVVICCAILHNVLLKESTEDVERLLQVIQNQNSTVVAEAGPTEVDDVADEEGDADDLHAAELKRAQFGVFLTVHRV